MNLLNAALRIQPKQTVQYSKFSGRTTNEIGFDVCTYDTAVDLVGSLQAVPRSVYEQMGLNFQKRYVMFYASSPIQDVGRDVSGDKIAFGSKTYQVVSATDWHPINGWQSVLCVEVTDA